VHLVEQVELVDLVGHHLKGSFRSWIIDMSHHHHHCLLINRWYVFTEKEFHVVGTSLVFSGWGARGFNTPKKN
jgi:hypothetical protein